MEFNVNKKILQVLIRIVPYQTDTPKNPKTSKENHFANSLPDLIEEEEEDLIKRTKDVSQLIFYRIIGKSLLLFLFIMLF